MLFSDTSITLFLTMFSSQAKHKDYTNHQPQKSPYILKKKWQCQMKKKIYWGVLFYSGWKFWLAIINALLAGIFSLLSCWHCIPYFIPLTFNLKLCLYDFASFCSCSRLFQKLCVCLFLVSDPVPPGAGNTIKGTQLCGNAIKLSQFNFCIFFIVYFCIKNN